MKSIQKGFKAEEPLIELLDKMQEKEHLNFSPLIKRIIWSYAEENHPELATEAKKKLQDS